MKQEFLNFINELMKANPELTEQLMTESVELFLKSLQEGTTDKPVLTDNGKIILAHLQNHQETVLWKAKELAESIGIASRAVSGTMRKLVNDGFCEKIGKDPAIYTLTDKGKTFVIE